ncbi:hypothetical protein HUT16_29020 [Kitasatospora sp. NA04385]|uniref:hypothetical protein n=1 Tax=Kitasatospora sp. NA04385 TaxID=2742135 RepID=UPI001590913B|nr:hypothetical protein [Kitasatospora sp. NA04385]QKW22590.1 hypothetical protein HUT16_29020 [Kitasatospora sp. NA04385]
MSDDLLEPLGLGPPESALHLRVPASPRSASTRLAESVDGSPGARSRTPTSGRPSPARGHLPAEGWEMVEPIEGQDALRHRSAP